MLNTRANLLTTWLVKIFDKPALDSAGQLITEKNADGAVKKDKNGVPIYRSVGQEIMDHCMTTALSATGKSTSYINAENFVSALLDKITLKPVAGGTAVQMPPENLPAYIKAIEGSTIISGELKRTILALANEASLAAKAIDTLPKAANITNNITTEKKVSWNSSAQSWRNGMIRLPIAHPEHSNVPGSCPRPWSLVRCSPLD